MLTVKKSEQLLEATQMLSHPHPDVPVQLIYLIVLMQEVKPTHPAPLVTHPVWYWAQASLVVVEAGASVQTLGEQAPAVVALLPLHFPSLPTYPSQVVVVPVYPEHGPRVLTHPFPVVTHPV
jgi:hypothetical protein